MRATTADAICTYPELSRLAELSEPGWRFVDLHDESGRPSAVVGSCERDGYSDMLWVMGQDETRATRVQTTTSRQLGEIVWAREGPLCETVQGLLELPAPRDQHAPYSVIRRL